MICVSRVSAVRRSMSCAVNALPLGLCGVLIRIIRVRGVIVAATSSQSMWNVSGDSLIATGVAPCNWTIGA